MPFWLHDTKTELWGFALGLRRRSNAKPIREGFHVASLVLQGKDVRVFVSPILGSESRARAGCGPCGLPGRAGPDADPLQLGLAVGGTGCAVRGGARQGLLQGRGTRCDDRSWGGLARADLAGGIGRL